MPVSYANGKFIPTDQLAIPFAADITGTVRGYRIFTACRTVGPKIFELENHLSRIYNSARTVKMDVLQTRDELRQIVEQTVAKNRRQSKGDWLVELMLSGGPAAVSGVAPAGPAVLYVVIFPLRLPPDRWYQQGITLATYPFQRQWPEVKLLNYVGGVVAHQTVVKKYKADEALFISPDKKKTVLEGTTFNFFIVNKEGVIRTAPLDGLILPGITRKVAIKLAKKHGIKVLERPFTYLDLKTAVEAFITSSTRNVVPVVKIDGFKIGAGRPGPVTRQLITAMMEYQAYY